MSEKIQMKRLFALILLTFAFRAGFSQSKNFIDQPYIEVNGYADTLVTPDEIYIRIPLSEKDSRDRVSIEDLEKKMVAGLKSLGVDIEKDLTASDMSSNFRYYLLKNKDVIKTKVYTLKVKDAVMATRVFIMLEEMDVSNSSIDRVDHSAFNDIRNQMRSKAMTDARKRAAALTQPLGQTAGAAIHITEVSAEPVNNQYRNRLSEVVIRGYGTTGNDKKELAQIDFEKIKIAASIDAKFVLK